MIRCNQVGLEYLAGKPVLKQLSLHLEPGSFTFIAGASGAGKSSLLSLLALSLKPTSGTVHLFGQDVTDLPREELPEYRRKIGTVFQDFQLLNHLTVAENVGLPLKIMGEAKEEIEEKVSDFDGHKSLYSDSYYSKEDFEELYYGGDRYIGLKERYDPKSRLLDLFSKAVQRK